VSLVSVLLPVHNAASQVSAAVRSVLSQTCRNLELIVVDDGSTDGSAAVVERFDDARLRVVRLPANQGLSAALNAGLRAARGELIARQDADDVSNPVRLERQVAALRGRPELALVGCQAWLITPAGSVVGAVDRPVEPSTVRWYGLLDNPFIHTAVMFRATIVRDELGGYDAAFDPYSQDFDLWSRLLARYPAANLPDRLVSYRMSDTSIIGTANAAPTSTYARRFDATIRRIVTSTLAHTFGDRLSSGEQALLAGFGSSVDSGSLPAFLAAVDHLFELFMARYPQCRRSPDFHRTWARQIDAIAFRLAPASRRAAFNVYRFGLRRVPEAVPYLSWPRALTLALLGRTARRWLSRRHAAAATAWIGSR
jgi:glycosyltransferase involved in cell wall biosynthesis